MLSVDDLTLNAEIEMWQNIWKSSIEPIDQMTTISIYLFIITKFS